jgi:uncharacterized iron-regulated protein
MTHRVGNCAKSILAVLAAALISGCASSDVAGPPGDLPPLTDLTAYALVDPNSGTPVSVADAAHALAEADVVFLGENHRHPGNHHAQMDIYRALQEINGPRGVDVALSLEQFERDVQPVVDRYLAGEIGEATLRDEGRAWDNYPVSYRPLVEYAKARGLPVIAAEAPNMVVRCVGRQGPEFLDTMPTEKRSWAAAKLHLGDSAYRDRFIAFAGGSASHGEPAGEDDEVSAAVLRSYAAQVTRDDTMAESIVMHLNANPGHQVVHLNGSFHSAGFLGTAERVILRNPNLKIAVVHPIEVDDPAAPGFADSDRSEGTFLLLIAPVPEAYATPEEERAAIMEQMKFRSSVDCEL